MTEVNKEYAAAYAMHYGAKNLRQALDLYKDITIVHRDTPQAGYARSQIQNIAKSLVSDEVLLDAQIKLAIAHCGSSV
jgi:hypothetical protein